MKRLFLILPVLVACTPVPMTYERAERLCREEVGLADGVAGRVIVGVGTGGARAKTGIVLTDRVFNPQSEEDFMADCIARRLNGEPAPTRVGVTIGGKL